MTLQFGIIGAGAMGSAVARRLTEMGGRVLSLLDGRSPTTARLAASSGMIAADEDQIAMTHVILSIVPPSEATVLARRLAPALMSSSRKPIFVDCNAIDVGTVQKVAAVIEPTGARFVDGGIIGLPPEPGTSGPTFYFSGAAAQELAVMRDYGLDVRVIDGLIGAASALKMSYAGITKGLTAIAAIMVLAASRAGSADALRYELSISQPQLLQRFQRALPDMYPKSFRWIAEMREIALFVGEDEAARRIFEGFADVYERLAMDSNGPKVEIDMIDKFLLTPD